MGTPQLQSQHCYPLSNALNPLWEKSAVRVTTTAGTGHLIINSEEKLFRKGIAVRVKPARAPNTWIPQLYSGLYRSAQEPACPDTKLKSWRRSSIAFLITLVLKQKCIAERTEDGGCNPTLHSTPPQFCRNATQKEVWIEDQLQWVIWWVQSPLCTVTLELAITSTASCPPLSPTPPHSRPQTALISAPTPTAKQNKASIHVKLQLFFGLGG